MTAVNIREYQPTDLSEWLRMRRALWPEIAEGDEAADAAAWLAWPNAVVLVAVRAAGGGKRPETPVTGPDDPARVLGAGCAEGQYRIVALRARRG